MVQVIQAHDITLEQLIELFGLTITYDEPFFTEWLDNLPEVTDSEKQQLDRVKTNYLSLVERHALSENLVKIFVFVKLMQQDTPQYAFSDQFSLWRRENQLYKVLSILKKLGQLISQ